MNKFFTTLSLLFVFTVQSQILTFTIQNNTGSNTITCKVQSINFSAAGTFSAPITYSWVSVTATLVGSTASITSAGIYTVFANGGTAVSSQTLSISSNTNAPQGSITPSLLTITCNSLSSAVTVTAAAISPTLQLSHQFMNPFGGTMISGSLTTLYTPMAPGTYTYVLLDSINGCIVSKNFTVLGTGFPTFSVTAPLGYTLGCSYFGVKTLQMINATSQPPGGLISYSLMSPGSSSALPAGTLSAFSVYTVNIPGTYTMVTRDNSTGCESRVQVTIIKTNISPPIGISAFTNTLSCKIRTLTLSVNAGFASGLYWSTGVYGSTINVSSPGIYSITANYGPTCSISTASIQIYDNIIYPPISGGVFGGLCSQLTDVIYPAGIGTVTSYSYLWTAPPNATVSSIYQASLTVNVPGIYTVAVTNTVNSCTSYALLIVTNCVGITQKAEVIPQVLVYPNPTKGELYVDISDYAGDLLHYNLHNCQGALVFSSEATKKWNLNLEKLPRGLYYLEIAGTSWQSRHKIIVEQ